MIKSPLLLCLLSLLPFTGCTILTHPTTAERSASVAEASADLKQHVLEEGTKSQFQVICSDTPFTFQFSFTGADFNFDLQLASKTATGSSALATAMTEDGYLVSAAHVAKPYVAVIGWMDGKVQMKFARVVYKKYFGTFGAELSILHVDAKLDSPLDLKSYKLSRTKVYAFVRDFENHYSLQPIGGHIHKITTSNDEPHIAVTGTDLTTWRGDSGGGVISQDGHLIGLTTGFKFSLGGARLVCLPDKEFIDPILASDRASAH